MNGEKIIYMTSGRTNMMVEFNRGGSNYNIFHTKDNFKECGRDTPYRFFKKYLAKYEFDIKRPRFIKLN
jgi:hypothetical protein